MESQLIISILTGSFALAGSLGGVLISAYIAKRADRQHSAIEDRKHWTTEWRHVYAVYLGIVRALLDEIEAAGNLLDSEYGIDKDLELDRRVTKFVDKWHSELQPALGEMLLIATPEVADLAARIADGLLYLTGVLADVKNESVFIAWSDNSREILEKMVNKMRSELGSGGTVEESAWKRDDWPWLPSAQDC